MSAPQDDNITSTTEGSPKKPLPNGVDSATSPTGFRHHLPQIATMSRNPKIAQSKASFKEVSTAASATLHVEGVGKVFHIGSDVTEFSELPKKQEEALSNSEPTEKTFEEKDDKNDTGQKDEYEEPETETHDNSKQIDKEGVVAFTANCSPEETTKDASATDEENILLDKTTLKQTSPLTAETPTIDSENKVASRRQRHSKGSTVKSTPHSDAETEVTSPAGGQVAEDSTQGSTKRQRKPKKLDLEEVATSPSKQKTPKEKVKVKTENVQNDSQVPVKWLVGDLVWSKVTGHPWWPCMVSYDPYLSIYTRLSNRKVREYHVQFFGDAKERGWIPEKNTMEFQGKAHFDEFVENKLASVEKKTEKSKIQKWYAVNPSKVKAVNIGVQEAEIALPFNRNERKAKFTFTYVQKKSKGTPAAKEVQKSETSEASKSASKGSEQSGKKGRKSDAVNGIPLPVKKRKLEVLTPETNKTAKRRKIAASPRANVGQEASFDVFCQKERDVVLGEHPEFDEASLIENLKERWCMMSQKQKSRYKSKYSEQSDLGMEMSGRKRKPSAKKMEAEEDNRAFDEVYKKKSPTSSPAKQGGRRKSKGKGHEEMEEVKEEIKIEEEMSDSKLPLKKKKNRSRKSEMMEVETASDMQSDDVLVSEPPGLDGTDEECEWEVFKLSSAGPVKRENLCQICEQGGELLECQGACLGFFHVDCLGLSVNPGDNFKCDECTTGVHSCFVCKKTEGSITKCSVAACGKFYHMECVEKFPQAKLENKSLICPLHNCHTCLSENLTTSSKATRGGLLRCVRCPVAYHVGDFCIAAGSLNLMGFNIVCPRHFQPISSKNHHSHINVTWCFNCSKGGTLLCCESCPAAYHAECLNIKTPSEDKWYCPECVRGKQPLYGEIIWVKLGFYRWWPGEICHPKNVPRNIQEKAHQVGEFPVRFLGSHDYYWLHKGRVFSFQDGDHGSREARSKGLAKAFTRGVKEATEAFKVWKKVKDDKEQIEIEKKKRKPEPYKYVKSNFPIGSVQIYKADVSTIARCECKPDQENPCGPYSECLNSLMMYECHPAGCPAGDKCQNQRFQKRLYPKQEPVKTNGRGWGLEAREDIKKGQFVNEYVGDLIDEEECKRRIEQAHIDNVSNFYMLTLDKNRIIDAGPKGNLSRFMNHSCNPNLETQKWNVNGDVRVGLFALEDIKKGTELTFNYNLDCLGRDKMKCCCGAANCSGYLGERPKSASAVLTEKKTKEAKLNKLKKKKRIASKMKHDDNCFRCGEGGELVMCDRGNCPKCYHLECLRLEKPPHGRWDCPWHHCDECGKAAVQKCVECPNSFCAGHSDGHTKTFEDRIYCNEHDELLESLAESMSGTSGTSDDLSESNSEAEAQSVGDDTLVETPEVPTKRKTVPKKERRESTDTPVPAKRGRKSAGEKKGKQAGKGKKGGKGGKGSNGQVTDDPLAVAPMFDDSDEEGFGLVIDIPNF